MAKIGRPKKTFSWLQFDKLCKYHCTQKEIADFFGCSVDLLNKKCLEEQGVTLSVFFEQKKSAGRARLKKLQWNLAENSPGLAIFLGKTYLGQTDEPADQRLIAAIQEAGLTPDDAINLIIEHAKSKAVTEGKVTFEVFCERSGYPPPYKKQCEMRHFGINGNEPRLLLGSRGYGKTDYITILGVAYAIYVDPTFTVTIITKDRERNAAILQEIAHALKANKVYVAKLNAKVLRVAGLQGKDPSVNTKTVRSSLRGGHPKLVVMDDPVTEDDTSEATRINVKKKYFEVLKLTKNVIIIGQPAHQFDLYADIRKLVKSMEVPHGTIPELDHDLDAQRAAGVDEASISASYHLKVLTDGGNPFADVKFIDKFQVGSAIAFIDPSFKGGDYTALTILRGYMGGVQVVGFTYKKAWNHCLEEMAKRMKQFGVQRLAFETNSLGDEPIIQLRKVFGSGVIGKNSNGYKHARIMAAGTHAQLIHLSKESDKIYIDQVVKYEYNATHDDAPDSLASCLEWAGLVRGKS